jgi:hypothetical protein
MNAGGLTKIFNFGNSFGRSVPEGCKAAHLRQFLCKRWTAAQWSALTKGGRVDEGQ